MQSLTLERSGSTVRILVIDKNSSLQSCYKATAIETDSDFYLNRSVQVLYKSID
jgi:hypothetical protein